MTLAGIIGLLLITLALIGNLARNLTLGEVQWLIIEVDVFLIPVGNILGMWLIYDHGLL
jgi:NhaP-type Na+/H+ or K+/H+ antiporter